MTASRDMRLCARSLFLAHPVYIGMSAFRTPSANEPRHEFDMRRVAELIDRGDGFEHVAAVDEYPRVAGEGRGIAGHRDDDADLAGGELLRLGLRALSWGIEHDGVEVAQLLRHQRTAEQVARFGL